MRLPPSVAALSVLLLAPAVLACGGGSDGGSGCDGPRREALDPEFLRHVLGDAEVDYTSDPPTSGPHQPAPPVDAVVDEALPRPVQVGLLEGGGVLLQHLPDLPDADRVRLEGLADAGVVVAPNPDLDHPVVATAWLYKLTCSSVDVAALQAFVQDRLGKGPDAQD